jgi:hypothetical protein
VEQSNYQVGDFVQILTLAGKPTNIFGLVTDVVEKDSVAGYVPVHYIWVKYTAGHIGTEFHLASTVRVLSSVQHS